jgi:N-formylglutamate amidohydrolase
MYNKIILHIPHSSDRLPEDCVWSGEIRKVLNRWTDWHTDTLFGSESPEVISFVFPWSRLYCDIERLYEDPMERIGQGIAYRSIDGCCRELSEEETRQILQTYAEAREAFYNMANEPGTLIIDCHSFPADLAPETDICIGFNEDDTRPQQEVIDMIAGHFREAGYSVGINEPYSNSVCASMDPNKARTKTIMIEINKAVYLDADGITPGKDFDKLKSLIDELYGKLLR